MKVYIKKIIKKLFKKPSFNKNTVLLKLSVEDRDLIGKIRGRNLTYLADKKLLSIIETVRNIEDMKLPGLFIEAGCALGGSTILISHLKQQNREFKVYDVFQMIPPPTEKDGDDVQQRYEAISNGKSKGLGGEKYYGYEKSLYEKVVKNLESFGINEQQNKVYLVKGLLQETMWIDKAIAFAHIDVDWYEPVKVALERTVPKLSVGGSIILDDYHDWSGCKKATDEYFRNKADKFQMDDSAGSMKVTRIKSDSLTI